MPKAIKVHLTDKQLAFIQWRSKETKVSESEVVTMMIDAFILDEDGEAREYH